MYSLEEFMWRVLTISELTSLIDKAYKEYVRYPDIEIRIVNYRPIKVLIDGEVNKPGLLTLNGSLSVEPEEELTGKIPLGLPSDPATSNDLYSIFEEPSNDINFYFPKVFDAIQKSGGVTEYSNLSKIKLIRENPLSKGGGKIETLLDLEKFILYGDDSHNIRIYDKDIIVINKLKKPNQKIISNAVKFKMNEQFIKVIVSGRVNFPGVFNLSRKSTLNDAIDMAGGAKVIRGPISYLSFKNDGTIDKEKN